VFQRRDDDTQLHVDHGDGAGESVRRRVGDGDVADGEASSVGAEAADLRQRYAITRQRQRRAAGAARRDLDNQTPAGDEIERRQRAPIRRDRRQRRARKRPAFERKADREGRTHAVRREHRHPLRAFSEHSDAPVRRVLSVSGDEAKKVQRKDAKERRKGFRISCCCVHVH
jgi:hypothetical protein